MQLNYLKKTIRDSAVLTGSYVAATVLGPNGLNTDTDPISNNKLILLVNFTKGSLTSGELKIEFSDDGTTYYQETNKAVSGGTTTLTVNEYTYTATGNYVIDLDYTSRYIKVSAKGTGTVTGSLLAIDSIISIKP
jgi:hypothetical protein